MTGVLFSFCLSTVSLFLHAPLLAAEGPVVSTQYGSLRGEYQKVKGTEVVVHSYLGVPFAKPPVGPLRLAPPQPAVDWQGIRDATLQPRMCLQDKSELEKIMKGLSMDMDLPELSEDCLYLNIHTPGKPTADTKLPVMVWIHGGGLVLGGASLYDGSALSAYESVVVVGIQYRLGILGFFSTGDEYARGNFGLLDQVAALRWVQENIHSFGGDPKSVTIFGESAGGVSVSLQLLSPLSSGLFHRAIAESGTADMKIVFNPLPVAQIVANLSGCDNSSSKGIVQCMMQTTEEEILNIYQQTKIPFFGVTVDGVFLTKSAEEVFQKKEFHKVPFLMGVTNDECGWAVINFFSPPGWEEGMDREQMTSLLSTLNPEPTGQQISEWITDEYLGTTKDRAEIRDRLTEAMGDLIFVIPTIRTAMFHRDAGVPVYLYEFQYGPSMLRKIRPSFVKSDHGDEVFFVFGTCFWDSYIKITAPFTEEENQLCRTMMAYWANFARTGSPNGAGLVPWQPYGQEQEYLVIGLEQKPGQRLKQNRFNFLTQTLPEKVRVLAEGKHREL